MYLRTKKTVEFNSGINSKKTEIVIGKIISVVQEQDFNNYGINFVLTDSKGAPILQSSFLVQEESIDRIDTFDSQNNDKKGNRSFLRDMAYAALLLHICTVFSLNSEDVEIIVEP